jgi:hypothetical protein
MPPTQLAECTRCQILAHRPIGERYVCPECRGPLRPGLADVGFDDALKVFGEPGEPWYPVPEPVPAPGGLRRKLVCADGHKVHSKDERAIDDWLHVRGIPHEREPKLKGMRPDWRVGNVYLEYWGMSGQQGYEARREEKLALYRKRRLRLVELFPEDLERLGAKLGFLLDAGEVRQQRLV